MEELSKYKCKVYNFMESSDYNTWNKMVQDLIDENEVYVKRIKTKDKQMKNLCVQIDKKTKLISDKEF